MKRKRQHLKSAPVKLSMVLVVLYFTSFANALVYYPQDWRKNRNGALTSDNAEAPFETDCIVALGNSAHNDYRSATVISPNFVLSCKHWKVSKGCRIKRIGNRRLYFGKNRRGSNIYREIYVVADRRDISGTDFSVYRIKKAINPKDRSIPDSASNYDWINDPNAYFEDANFTCYMPLYTGRDELNKDVVIAGFGPQRIFGVHKHYTIGSHAVAPGTLHWGYNQIFAADEHTIKIYYDSKAKSGKKPNVIGAARYDSGTGWYIKDKSDGKYMIVTTFYGATHGPRISSYIDDIAKNVATMGTPTLSDRLLAGLKPSPSAPDKREVYTPALNPVGPNAGEQEIPTIAEGARNLLHAHCLLVSVGFYR